MRTIEHWIGGNTTAGTSTRTAPVWNPATGEQQAEVLLAERADVDDRRRSGRGRVRGVVAGVAEPAHQGALRVPRAGQRRTSTSSPSSSPTSTARSSPTPRGEVQRGLEVVEFACGIPHLLKGDFSDQVSTDVDTVLVPPAARRRAPASRRSTSRPWCRCGCTRSRSPAATRSCSSRASATRRPRMLVAELWRRGRPARRRVQRRARRQGGRRRAARPPGRRRGLVRRLHPDRPVHPRAGHARTASGSRPSAAPRTTPSCCPTPTSTSPPTTSPPPRSARPASAAWPSPPPSPSAPRATRSSRP